MLVCSAWRVVAIRQGRGMRTENDAGVQDPQNGCEKGEIANRAVADARLSGRYSSASEGRQENGAGDGPDGGLVKVEIMSFDVAEGDEIEISVDYGPLLRFSCGVVLGDPHVLCGEGVGVRVRRGRGSGVRVGLRVGNATNRQVVNHTRHPLLVPLRLMLFSCLLFFAVNGFATFWYSLPW